MTYDLRRLRQHGFIERVPRTFRYQVADDSITRVLFLPGQHRLAARDRPQPGRRRPGLHRSHRRPRPESRTRRPTPPATQVGHPDLQTQKT